MDMDTDGLVARLTYDVEQVLDTARIRPDWLTEHADTLATIQRELKAAEQLARLKAREAA